MQDIKQDTAFLGNELHAIFKTLAVDFHDGELDDAILLMMLTKTLGMPMPANLVCILRGNKDTSIILRAKETVFKHMNEMGDISDERLMCWEEKLDQAAEAKRVDNGAIHDLDEKGGLVDGQAMVQRIMDAAHRFEALNILITAPCASAIELLSTHILEHKIRLPVNIVYYTGTYNAVQTSASRQQHDASINTCQAIHGLRQVCEQLKVPMRLYDFSRAACLAFSPVDAPSSSDAKSAASATSFEVPKELTNVSRLLDGRWDQLKRDKPDLYAAVSAYNRIFNKDLIKPTKLMVDFSKPPATGHETEDAMRTRLAKLARSKALQASEEFKRLETKFKDLDAFNQEQVKLYIEDALALLKNDQNKDLVDPRKWNTLDVARFETDAPLADMIIAWFIWLLVNQSYFLDVQASTSWTMVQNGQVCYTDLVLDDAHRVISVIEASDDAAFLAIRVRVSPTKDQEQVQRLVKLMQQFSFDSLMAC